MQPHEIKDYCYNRIYELAKLYEAALSSRMEYETAFYYVMDVLSVPKSEQEKMLSIAQHWSEAQGIPYHRLSPVNQFVQAVGPYIWYCFENSPPSNISPEEAERITNDPEFSRFIEQLARKISQQVKGALWKPGAGCIGKTALFVAINALVLMGIYVFCNVVF